MITYAVDHPDHTVFNFATLREAITYAEEELNEEIRNTETLLKEASEGKGVKQLCELDSDESANPNDYKIYIYSVDTKALVLPVISKKRHGFADMTGENGVQEIASFSLSMRSLFGNDRIYQTLYLPYE